MTSCLFERLRTNGYWYILGHSEELQAKPHELCYAAKCLSALKYFHTPEVGIGCEFMLFVAMVICIVRVLITSSKTCIQEQCGTST